MRNVISRCVDFGATKIRLSLDPKPCLAFLSFQEAQLQSPFVHHKVSGADKSRMTSLRIAKFYRDIQADFAIAMPNSNVNSWLYCLSAVGLITNKKPRQAQRRATKPSEARHFLFKRNAKAFSLNAIVDVRHRRLRCYEQIFLNISETVRACAFKIYRKVAIDNMYISTGNDVINYFP